jgi:hypothetical protein
MVYPNMPGWPAALVGNVPLVCGRRESMPPSGVTTLLLVARALFTVDRR